MPLSNAVSRRWEKIRSTIESLDRAFNESPIEDQARRLAAIEARMDAVEESIGRGALDANLTSSA